ncbi:MAG: glycosyltransferase family 2 protein [Mycobacteriales bacterium]
MSYAALLVHYEAPDLLLRALGTLAAQTVAPAQVLVANNGGRLPDLEALTGALPSGWPPPGVLDRANDGYGGAVNDLVALVDPGIEHLLVLTQDVQLDPLCVERLAGALDSHRELGVVGPELMLGDTSRLYSGGGRQLPGGGARHHRALPPSGYGTRQVDWLDGAVLLVRTDAFREVGGFDVGYFLYHEDVDMCFRLRCRGHGVAVVEGARASQLPGNYTTFLRFRNQVLFGLTASTRGRTLAAISHQFLRTCVGSALRRDPRGPGRALQGARAGFRGETGPVVPPRDRRRR